MNSERLQILAERKGLLTTRAECHVEQQSFVFKRRDFLVASASDTFRRRLSSASGVERAGSIFLKTTAKKCLISARNETTSLVGNKMCLKCAF